MCGIVPFLLFFKLIYSIFNIKLLYTDFYYQSTILYGLLRKILLKYKQYKEVL